MLRPRCATAVLPFRHPLPYFSGRRYPSRRPFLLSPRPDRVNGMDTLLSFAEAHRIWGYDPETGRFWWKIKPSKAVNAGDVAGTVDDKGYRVLRYRRKRYKAHRVAWFLMTGEWPSKIDHENMNKADNRFFNLRIATQSQNKANEGKRQNNTSGLKGVSLHRKTGKFQASIARDGTQVYLGLFATVEEANVAYGNAAKLMFGEFARAS